MVGLLLLAAGIMGGAARLAAAEPALEYKTKAAFLCNFAKFVEWPADKFPETSSPIVIGVAGEDPFGTTLDEVVAGRTIYGRPVAVRRFAPGEDLKRCHILFISRSLQQSFDSILAPLKTNAVLTVSESDKFVPQGGIINFVMVNETVKFDINPAAAARAGLRVSSKLSSVGRVIRSEPGGVN